MKRTYRHSIATFLFSLSTLLLCLGSCQSSDEIKQGAGATVASLPLKAQMGNASSRVGMTDSGGSFSYYWDNDKLNIWNKYVLNGTVQSILPLEFVTTDTKVTSATFSYKGGGAYRYNPTSRLYVFSKGTSGGYTATVTDAGVSTLTANTLANQTGTLSDCAKYDALYGSANMNVSTGLSASVTMNHLFGMLNLHLTSITFSTSHPVTVTLTSSVSNILPGNGGIATLNADGTLATLNGSWGTSWSGVITPTTNGVVDVYLMTWPFSAISGTLTVSCSDGSYNAYVARIVTLSGFSLAAAQLKSKPLAITNIPPNTTYSKVYAWDATNSLPVTLGTVPTNANTTPVASSSTDYTKRASHACASCPNGYEITWYLSVPCYWDNGSINGGNITNYKMADSNYTKAGMWFKKHTKITGFTNTASSGTTSRTPILLSTMSASDISALNLSTDYFFLPAAGDTDLSGGFTDGGVSGSYWSSTPATNINGARGLYFYSGNAIFIATTNAYARKDGFCLWLLQ